jgi:RNA polymerase sigma-70 factor (ECF subfamily)
MTKQEHFLQLLEPAKDRLWRYVKSMLRQREDTEDVYGETVLAAFEKLDSLKDESAFLYFLFGIARRIVLQRQRKVRLFDSFTKNRNPETQTTPNPGASLDLEILYKALDKLNTKEREAIVMFEISGFSLAEIQELQKDSLSAVKSRLSRGREKLKKIMAEHPGISHPNTVKTLPEMLTI